MLRITGTLAKGNSKKEINSSVKALESKLNHIKLKGKIDEKRLQQEINKSLHNLSFDDIDILDVDGGKTKLKLKKVVADAKAYLDRNTVSVNVEMKKEKLKNDLTAFLNKNSKVRESSVLLEEGEKVRGLIEAIKDKGTLQDATDAFQLYKSEVTATGYATRGTTEKIKDMISHVTKIGSMIGLASLAINNFKKSLSTIKGNDTILTEISKTSEMTRHQIQELGDEAFRIASRYGQSSSNFLLGVQEMARSGYEDLSRELGELSLLAQSAGDMVAENANNYLLATDAAYKYGGSVERLKEVLDGANYISNKNSASLTDIADAARVSASYAANAGIAIDELTAAEATMIATTKRSGAEIGRAFRSIVLNLQQVSGEFDGETIDQEQLRKVEERCHSLGVELEYVKDGMATLRNPMEVLKDLAEVYNSLPDDSAEKQGLVSDLGGKYHANALSALLSRWDMYEKMLGEYSKGTGSAFEEAEKTANSWEGRLNSLQNSFDSFVNSLTNKEAVMGSITFFDRMLQGADSLMGAIGEITVMVGTLGTAMTAMNKDYGITQIWNGETGKMDIQGNIFGIDITNIKNMRKHFSEAESAIAGWNSKLLQGQVDINKFNDSVVQNSVQLKKYLSTCSREAPASLEGYKSYLNSAGVATDGLRLKTLLLNAAVSFGIGLAVQAVAVAVSGLREMSQVSENVAESARELGRSFSDAKSDIDGYKSKIEELYATIHDSSSSIEDVTDARKNLMAIQDELIEKFGTEKSVIGDVTEAINGQTDALDRLTEARWQETKNQFNNGGFWNDAANFLEGKDNIERMLDEYGEKTILFKWSEFADITKLTDEMVAELENIGIHIKVTTDDLQGVRDFDSLSESIANAKGASLSLTGNAEDIYNQLLALQNLIGKDDSLERLYRRVETTADSYKDLTDNYKDFYNQYILNEKILSGGSAYADTFKDITDAYRDYRDAFMSGDAGEIEEATGNYARVLTEAISRAMANGDSDVAAFFEDMYPELQSAVKGWNFNVAFDADTDGLRDKVQAVLGGMKDENGRELTTEEILGLDGADKGYQALVSIAHSYNITLEEMIGLLKERNLVADMDYQGLVGLFGQDNVNRLSPEDLEIAYTVKNVGNMTFEELREEIRKTRQVSDGITNFPAFTGTDFGTRIQHMTSMFNDGAMSHKEYFDALQSEIDKFDASGFTDSIKEMDHAMQQFFVDSVQQAADGLSSLISSFDKGEMGISEYLEGYLSIGNTLSALTDSLQENSAAWDKNGEAISETGNTALDDTQDMLDSAISVIESYQDSIYSLEQIMSGAAEEGSDEFAAHAEVIAEDLSRIVQTGGEMAGTIANTLGTTTSEIAKSLTENVSNQEIACQAIMANTNNAITGMADSIGKLFDTLGDAISNFKVDLSFGVKSIDWKKVNVLGAELSLPEIKFELGASGESLDKIGSAISSFGKTIASNYTPQTIELEDFHFGSTDAAKDRKYSPSSNITNNHENALDKIKDATKSTNSAVKSEFEDMVDFFERRIEVLDDAVSLLMANLENLTGSFAKNQLLNQSSSILEESMRNYSDAIKMYQQKAQESLSKLDLETQKKIIDGSVSLTDYIGEGNKAVVEAINDYSEWSEKVAEHTEKLANLRKELRELELQKFNNVISDFESQFDLRGDSKDLISKQIDLLKEAGELIGSSFFIAQIDQSKKQLELLEAEKAQLVNQMSSAISSGRVQKGTEEWLEMVNALSDVDSNILTCKKSIEELDNSILELHTEIFDRIQKQFSSIADEADSIIGLFDDMDVARKDNTWTKEGLTQLGLLVQQYELAQYRVSQYNDEINRLNADYVAGKYSATEYADRLADLNRAQWDAVNSAESAKDSIMDLNEARVDIVVDGINEEIQAYRDLTDAQIEALDAAKDLHEYENTIAEKTKSVNDLERQISAMQNDTSASTMAKRKKLEEQLAQAKKDLAETEYQHSIEVQKDALNKQYEDYEKERNDEIEALRASLKDMEAVLTGSFDAVKNNSAMIGQEIAAIAAQHGVTVSTSLISAWQSGAGAVAGYGEVLSQNTSAFIGNIMGVENEVWNLQARADDTATSLAWMFSSRADTLVGELTTSYYAEANLADMTDALQQSLVNTLERGYDISSIVSSLDSVRNAANEAANAVNRIGNIPSSGGSQGNKGYTGIGASAAAGGGSSNLSYKALHYAGGTRSSKGNIIITDEEGTEMKLPKLSSGQYTIANEGTQVLTKAQTDNLYDWAAYNPENMIAASQLDMEKLSEIWRNANIQEPPVVDGKATYGSPVQIGNLISVQGNIDNTNIKQMESIANKAVNKLVNKLHDGIKYGR